MAAKIPLDEVAGCHSYYKYMTANVDKDAYMYPKPRLEAAIQVGFLPSRQLDTALRGFLLPEAQRDPQTTNRKVGQIVLKTVAERRFGFDRSDNDGIRFASTDKVALKQETNVFDEMAEEPIGVTDIALYEATNHDIVVAFPLNPTPEQRRRLGGVVLQEHLSVADRSLIVYKRFDHRDIVQDEQEVIHRAAAIRRAVLDYHQWEAEHPRSYVASPFYVSRPHHTGAQLRSPRVGK